MPYSAQQLDKILVDIEAGKYDSAGLSRPRKLSDDAQGKVVSLPISDNTEEVIFRRRPDGIWETHPKDEPPAADDLSHFGAKGGREAAIKLIRDAAAAVQREFPSDAVTTIEHGIALAFGEANHSPEQMTLESLVRRYRAWRSKQ